MGFSWSLVSKLFQRSDSVGKFWKRSERLVKVYCGKQIPSCSVVLCWIGTWISDILFCWVKLELNQHQLKRCLNIGLLASLMKIQSELQPEVQSQVQVELKLWVKALSLTVSVSDRSPVQVSSCSRPAINLMVVKILHHMVHFSLVWFSIIMNINNNMIADCHQARSHLIQQSCLSKMQWAPFMLTCICLHVSFPLMRHHW